MEKRRAGEVGIAAAVILAVNSEHERRSFILAGSNSEVNPRSIHLVYTPWRLPVHRRAQGGKIKLRQGEMMPQHNGYVIRILNDEGLELRKKGVGVEGEIALDLDG